MRRVVVTGLGIVSPIGTGIPHFWEKLLKGESGVQSLKAAAEAQPARWDKSEVDRILSLPSTIAANVTLINEGTSGLAFNPNQFLSNKEQQDISLPIKFGMSAAELALKDANWNPSNLTEKERTGVAVGSGIGCLSEIINTSRSFDSQGYRKVNPFFVPKILINMTAGHISIKHGFYGPNHSVSTACATGAHAIGDAYRMILADDADVMIAGGTESSIDSMTLAGFAKMRALATKYNDDPTKASRPFDMARNGFVLGEGAGIVILEELEHARKRGAKIYAEISGYGLSGDGYHITSPSAEGRGAILSMKRALKASFSNKTFDPSQIDYINAHATSTPIGDETELKAIAAVFGSSNRKPIAVSSIKGSIGHLLGAAGAVEAIATILAVHHDVIPPTINLQNPVTIEAGYVIDHVANKCREQKVNAALTNSFGFGGTNTSLLFTKYVK